MPAAGLNSMLDHAVDGHFDRPAVLCSDHETDYERFDEAVEWVSGDLAARGVQARQRVGLCVSGGWEFLIAFHALLRLDVVVVPVNPYDDAALRSCRQLDLHYAVSHRDTDPFIEEMVETICGEETRPIVDIAEVFTLVVVSADSPLHGEGGLLLYDNGFDFSTVSEVIDRVAALQRNLELNPRRCVVIHGPWSCPSAVLLVLASAASGSCVNVVPVAGRSLDVWAAASAGDTAVVFAQLMPMHEIVRIASTTGQGCLPPRMMLPDGEPLSEALIRRCGLIRHSSDDPPIYEFASHTRSADPPTVPDFDCLCCETAALLTVS